MKPGYDLLAQAIHDHGVAEQLVEAAYRMQEAESSAVEPALPFTDDERMQFAMTAVLVLRDPTATPGMAAALDYLRTLAGVDPEDINQAVLDDAAGMLIHYPTRPRGEDDIV